MSETLASPADLAWCQQRFAQMREGGVWAVPRSGLIFERRGDALVLTGRMPWTLEMAAVFEQGADVPSSAGALRAYQDADYDLIRGRFEAAGIPMTVGEGL